MKNNPYIEKVLAHPYIFTKEEDIYGKQGKWCEYFENDHALVLEIGTGHGNFFSSEVHDHPEKNYIGMEIKYKRLYSTAEKCLGNKSNYAQSSGTDTTNFVLLKEYGQKIGTIFGGGEIRETVVFFPDPWAAKDRQKKHRLLQRGFLEDVYRITKSGGKLYIKTDHEDYFQFVLEEVATTQWNIHLQSFDYVEDNLANNTKTTEFEQMFRGDRRKFCYLELRKES